MPKVDPGERIDLPNGSAVYYVDADHSYWRCKPDGSRGRRLTGVTTVVKPFDFDPERLLKWAAKKNGEGIATLVADCLSTDGDAEDLRTALVWLLDEDTIWRELENAELTFAHIRDQAAVKGTNVHKLALQALAMGKAVPDYEGMTVEERGYAQGVVGFWLDHSPEPLQVEQIVADEELGVAGRPDLRAVIHDCGDELCPCAEGQVGLIDAKTGFWISQQHHAQVAMYDLLLAKCGFGASDFTAILKVAEDGTYELLPVRADPTDALVALDVYRRSARIRNEASKDRKARQAAEKVPA